MKSTMITRFRLSDNRQSQLKALCSLPSASLTTLAQKIRGFTQLPLSTPQFTMDLASALATSGRQASEALNASLYLLNNMQRHKDSPSAIADDLRDLGLIDEQAATRLVAYLDSLKDKAAHILLLDTSVSTAMDGASVLHATEMQVAFKPVIEKRYSYDDGPVSKYDPVLIGIVPVCQIQLIVQDAAGESRNLDFQVTEQALDLLLSNLTSLQTELIKAKAAISIKV